jgi:CheY-like chemotaxis protein
MDKAAVPAPIDVLLVEDNLDHADIINTILKEQAMSVKVHYVSDGEMALDYIFRRNAYSAPEKSPTPKIILLDLRISKIDGFDVLRAIKNSETHRAIPVVVLTSSESRSDIDTAYKLLANSYLVKPVDFGDFSEMLNSLVSYWLKWSH